jgi:hypothetical protein
MNNFHRHPDGMVFVRVGENLVYSDTPENFEADFGVTLPPLPEGATEQIYDQGRRHAFHNHDGLVAGGEMPWPAGDQVIASIIDGLAMQRARKAPEGATS